MALCTLQCNKSLLLWFIQSFLGWTSAFDWMFRWFCIPIDTVLLLFVPTQLTLCTYTQQDIATSWAKYARICVNCSTSWWVRTTRVVTRICAHSSYTGHLCIQQMNLSNSKLLCLWPCNISYMFDNQEYHQLEDNISISFWI